MKRILIFFMIAASVSLLSSCKKFLEAESLTNNPKEFLFSSESEARKAVLGIYQGFSTDAFTSRYTNQFQMNTDVEVGNVNPTQDGGRRDIWNFLTADNNTDFALVWNQAYSSINKANECEDGLINISLKADPSNKQYKQLLGEAKTLRAFWYYVLIDCWGDVPFKITPTKTGENFFLPKTGRDSILSFLVEDLMSIEPDMLWADQNSGGIEYVNREYTIGMIARLSLMRGGYWLKPDLTMHDPNTEAAIRKKYYEIANTYCKKLVNLKPRPLGNYAQVFLNQNKYISPVNGDMLFEVAYPLLRGDQGYVLGVNVVSGTHAYGGTGVQMLLSPAYYFSFDTSDLRVSASCSIINYSSTLQQGPVSVTNIAINKWSRLLVPTPLGSTSSKGTGINWPMMRYSDVLLMLAETENELNNGPTAEAQAALIQVRQRVFPSSLWGVKVNSYVSALGNKQAFFNAIVNERAWEFGGEFLRKHDLIRWGNYGQKVAEVRNTLVQLANGAVNNIGPYASYPDKLYYTRNPDNTISWLSQFRKPTGPVPAGYTATNWLVSLWNTTTNLPSDYYINMYKGYTDLTGNTPLRYIFPIHQTVIAASQGTLKNEYGY